MTAPTPNQTHEQRMTNLALANEIRSARAVLKRDLRARRVALLPLIMDPPEHLHTMRVQELLLAAPKVGQIKVHRLLTVARLSPSKTLGGLSKRQRVDLARILIERRI